jgi:signal transduction histidine kinase
VASSFFPHKGSVEMKVTDTGRGIAREDLSKIFDPFFSTKKEGKGLGLGLSVVYAIIDRHKGTISAESMPGEGTVFTITLPVKG